jgi:hypothetical protein
VIEGGSTYEIRGRGAVLSAGQKHWQAVNFTISRNRQVAISFENEAIEHNILPTRRQVRCACCISRRGNCVDAFRDRSLRDPIALRDTSSAALLRNFPAGVQRKAIHRLHKSPN